MSTHDLADEARVLLRAAALEQTLARPDLLGEVTGLPEDRIEASLAQARRRGLLVDDRDRDVIRFRHPLLRESVEAEMLGSERRSLHRAWARALDREAGSPVAPAVLVVARARHWDLSQDRTTAFPVVLAAARYVDSLEDLPARAFWWGRVLDLWPGHGAEAAAVPTGGLTRDRVLDNLMVALAGAGHPRRALEVVRTERAAGREPDPLRALWLDLSQRHLARLADGLEAAPRAPSDPDRVFTWLRGLGPDFRVMAALHFLLHEWDAARPDLYMPICDELARRGDEAGDVEAWYLAMRHRGWWQQSLGDFDGQIETARGSREVVLAKLPSRRLEAEWDWCWGLEEAGRYAEAVLAAEGALAQVEEPRAMLNLWLIVACCAAAADSALGRWDDALAWLSRIEDVSRGSEHHTTSALRAGLWGEITARRGEVDEAAEALEPMVDDCREPEAVWSLLPVLTAAAEIALLRGDRALAGRILRHLDELPHAVGGPDAVALSLLALSRLAAPADVSLLAEVVRTADRLMPPGGRLQLAVRAEMGEHDHRILGTDSPRRWGDVAEVWQRLERPYDVAWCRYVQAEAALQRGDRDVAAAALAEAWRIAGDLGARPLAERIAAVARRGRLGLQGLASNAVPGLTARETEVLGLIAVGRTNAQIAEELFMSPKTASVHVSRILAKLGAVNRTQAAATARRLGVADPDHWPGLE